MQAYFNYERTLIRSILKAMQKGQAKKFAVELRTKQLCIENYVSHSMVRANLNLTAITVVVRI